MSTIEPYLGSLISGDFLLVVIAFDGVLEPRSDISIPWSRGVVFLTISRLITVGVGCAVGIVWPCGSRILVIPAMTSPVSEF